MEEAGLTRKFNKLLIKFYRCYDTLSYKNHILIISLHLVVAIRIVYFK